MASHLLREELLCSVCRDIYRDPVRLTCGHNFCRGCITQIWDKQREKEEELQCPECTERSRRPEIHRNPRLRKIADRFLSNPADEEETQIFCTYCVHAPVPAAKTCLHCEASLCDTHVSTHNPSREHILTEPSSSLRDIKCSIHGKLLEYYCSEDSTCICVSCCLVGEHRGHQVQLLNEASLNKKSKLQTVLDKIMSEREEIDKSIQSLRLTGMDVPDKLSDVNERVTALFLDIREQLEVLEKKVLTESSKQEKQTSLRVTDRIQQLVKQKDDLSNKMYEMEALCNISDPLTFLQGWDPDIDDCSDAEEKKRNEKERSAVGDLNEGLISKTLLTGLAEIFTSVKNKYNVQEASDSIEAVNWTGSDAGAIKHASDTHANQYLQSNINSNGTPGNRASNSVSPSLYGQETTDIVLDNDTVSLGVELLENLKMAAAEQNFNLMWQFKPSPNDENRFSFGQIFSKRSFSSGHHYWDIEFSEYGTWQAGVSYACKGKTNQNYLIGQNFRSWCFGKNVCGFSSMQHVLKHDRKEINVNHEFSCNRIRISLDYEGGRLSFYELSDPISHLYTFNQTFTEPLFAAFSVSQDAWVRIKS